MFCYPDRIDPEMARVFTDLKRDKYLAGLTAPDFAAGAAHFLAELNAIHPFREGNGRAQNSFLKLLSDFAGHPIDLQKLDPDRFLAAMIASFSGDEAPLARELTLLIA
jgi:cell filamentation protein